MNRTIGLGVVALLSVFGTALLAWADNDFTDALPPQATISVTPFAAFPGDQLTASSTSTGTISRTWTWITNQSDAVVAGSPPFGSGQTSVQWTIPNDLLVGDSYTVHVAVENTDNPYNPSLPGDQLAEQAVTIDRAPQATISITPDAVITGDTVTLTANADGNPSTGGSTSPFAWTVSPPTGGSTTMTGAQVQVPLTASGTWCFQLEIQYQHEASGGGLYQAEDNLCRTVSSVAAAFTVSPSAPLEGDQIILDGSSSTYQLGVNPTYQWTFLDGPTTYTGCTDAPSCVIPPDTLTASAPGTPYEVQLTLTNPANSDQDSATKTFHVADDDINADFSFAPSSPEIGQTVVFTTSGLVGEIDQITWFFGGEGCSGYASPTTCTPDVFNDCTSIAYRYAAGGTKDVHYVVTINGEQSTSPTHTVTVDSSGSCDGCSYAITPSSQSFAADGGTASFSVQTSSGCAWSAVSNRSWIQVTSGTNGSGSGTVSFLVQANTSSSARSGGITVANQTFRVTQSGAPTSSVDFSVSDTNPDIGQQVTFAIAGSADSWQTVRWNTGGAHCDGSGAVVDCGADTAGCTHLVWEYATAGTKTVTLMVDEGLATQANRSRTITVSNQGTCLECTLSSPPTASFTMTPTAPSVGAQVQFTDTSTGDADQWFWTITLNGATIKTANASSFTHTFSEAGLYQITLTAGNCAGEDTAVEYLDVTGAIAAREYIVPAVVHATGQNDTVWKSDLRIYNPCATGLDVQLDFLELGRDNSGQPIAGVTRSILPNQTWFVDDVLTWIPSLGDSAQGSLRVSAEGPSSSCSLAVMSRTYNDTPEGTYGQYVPAVEITAAPSETLKLTGLIENVQYRTNIGLANLSDSPVGTITMRLLGPDGSILAEKNDVQLPPLSSVQVVNVARAAGITQDLDLFTLEIDLHGGSATAYASVIDNRTGDPVLYVPALQSDATTYLPGMAHIAGIGSSLWRSDLSLFNPNDTAIELRLTYYPEELDTHLADWMLEPKAALFLADVVDLLAPGVDSKGYFTINTTSMDSTQTLAPGFTWTPASPDIGELVLLALTGISGTVESVEWDFDDPGCSGQATTCTASVWDDCSQMSFRFASSGPHAVHATIDYAAGAQASTSTQTVTVSDQGSCPGGSCTYAISPSSSSFAAAGGNGTISVSATAGCNWNATTSSGWIQLVSGSSGSGSGSVTYTVAANSSSSSRNATITVANRTHSIYQEGASIDCTFTLSPLVLVFAAQGGDGALVIATDQSCSWSATTSAPWVSFSDPTSGSGSGTLLLSVEPNPSTQERTAQVMVANRSAEIRQAGSAPQLQPVIAAARTYNLAPEGTFGQGIAPAPQSGLMTDGTRWVIPGVTNSSDSRYGFRTNLGLINSSQHPATVDITVYAFSGGNPVITIPAYPLAAGQAVQFNLFAAGGFGDRALDGTVELRVAGDGEVLAYASIIDNETQDPTFVPPLPVQ